MAFPGGWVGFSPWLPARLPRRGRPSMQTPLRAHRRLHLHSTLVPTDPPLASERAVSAAVDRTPAALVHSNRALQLLALLRTARPKQSGEPHWQKNRKAFLLSRRKSQASCPCRLLRFAPMRRCAGTSHRLSCGAACCCCRCADLSVPRPSRSGRSRCPCSAHPGRACTRTPPHRVAHASSIDSIAASTWLLSPPSWSSLRRRNAAVNAAPSASFDVCLTLLTRAGYRFCPILKCAGHSWPSDQR